MGVAAKVDFRYKTMLCALLRKRVWAIVTRQPNGSWKTVNCLDKDESCCEIDCAFTTATGQWPYPAASGVGKSRKR